MRQIILDTETTGLDPAAGHRIIEVAAVEIANRRHTDRHFHRYVNPGRDSEDAALRVHGLTPEFLSDKPKFSEIAEEFLEFVSGSELIIHNAAFDVAFLDYELSLLGKKPISACCLSVVDTLKLAREIHPGKRNALDSLCERYAIDHSRRTLHGALLDAQLLAEVYLSMTRGQESLCIDDHSANTIFVVTPYSPLRQPLRVLQADHEELTQHEEYLEELANSGGPSALWRYAGPIGVAVEATA